MRRVIALTLLAGAAFASAAPGPQPTVFDSFDGSTERVRYVEHNDSLVIRAVAFIGHPLVIELGDGETIREIVGGGLVSGDDMQKGIQGAWEVGRSGTRMFVRPLLPQKHTTILVVTAKGRTYVVELASATPTAKEFPRRVARIVVRAPRLPVPVLASVPLPASAAATEVAAAPAAEERQVARIHNEQYSMEVVELHDDVRPSEVYDDGRFTYFRFAANLPIPAIYKSVPGTTDEWLVNSHMEGDYVVVHGVGKLWNLRLDRSVVGVFNDAFDPAGAPPIDGSSVANQKRVRR